MPRQWVGSGPRHDLVASRSPQGELEVGARFIVPSDAGGRGVATPLPSDALRRPGRTDATQWRPYPMHPPGPLVTVPTCPLAAPPRAYPY